MVSYFIKKTVSRVSFLFMGAVFLIVWLSSYRTHASSKGGNPMRITSSAFEQGKKIPTKYTCDDIDISPPLSWSGAPDKTKSFALICDDPDAPMGAWVHWVIYNMPAKTNELREAVPTADVLISGARQGESSFGRIGYGGPCPPRGHGYHRYFFKLYALDSILDLKERAVTADKLLKTMAGHILAEAQLMGKFTRKINRFGL